MKKPFFNKALRILLLTNGLVMISGAMVGPIYALFVEKIGGSLLDASLTGGIFALAASITTLIAGKFADQIKENELIVAVGYSCLGIGFVLYMFIDSVSSLFMVQALMGFAEAFYAPSFDAIYSKHLSKKKAGREWGAWEAMHYFSLAVGAATGGVIANAFGFNAIFIVMATLCFISSLYIWFLPRKVL